MKEQKKENQFSGMTPEEIRLEAKRQIVRSAFLALAALIVIGVACYAWFVSSKTVTAEVGKVALNLDSFELASVGTPGKYDVADSATSEALMPTDWQIQGESWPETQPTGTQTSWDKKTILWQMTDDNNLGNYSAMDEGIRPGASGTLEFYILKKKEGQLTVNCYLDIRPMKNGSLIDDILTESVLVGNEAVKKETNLNHLLRGHLLFTYAVDGDPKSQLTRISDGGFSVTVPDHSDQVKVTLKWYWPYFLSHAMEYYQDQEIREKMMTRVVESLADGKPRYFFTEDALSEYVGYPKETTPTGGATTSADNRIIITEDNVRQYAKRLGKYYNDADQLIGDNVDSIVLCLRAVEN